MAKRQQGRQTSEWLAAWNALDTLEGFWLAQGDLAQGVVVDRILELRARMTGLLQPSLTQDRARSSRGPAPARRNAEQLPPAAESADGFAKVPPPLQPAYAKIAVGLRQLHAALQASYGHDTQADSVRQYLACLQKTLVKLAATLGDSPNPDSGR